MAKSKAIAVTVSQYYLSKELFAVKLMSIYQGKAGIYFWHTFKTLCTHTECSKLTPMAIEYCLDKNIPFISNLLRGQSVNWDHQTILKKHYGSKLSELIT